MYLEIQIANHQASIGDQQIIGNGYKNTKNPNNMEALDACPDGNEQTSGPKNTTKNDSFNFNGISLSINR